MRRNLSRQFSARVLEVFDRGPAADGVRIRAAKNDAPAEILIYDVIGADFWGEGITAKGVLAALAEADGAPVTLRLNSPGGDAFEGLAIYNALRGYAGGVSVVVDGLAASAASVVAMAGSSVSMNAGSMLMIHNAWTIVAGDRNDMTKQASTLAKIDGQLASLYASFSGKPAAQWSTAMDAETWYTADEAVAAGLASDVIPAPERPKAALADKGSVFTPVQMSAEDLDALVTRQVQAEEPACQDTRKRRLRAATAF